MGQVRLLLHGKHEECQRRLVPRGQGNAPSSQDTRVYLNCDRKLDEVLAKAENGVPGWSILPPAFGERDGLSSSPTPKETP